MPPAVVALGESSALAGFAMAGVRVLAAEDSAEVRRRWADLPPETGLVILTNRAAEAVADLSDPANAPLVAVLPP
ncbi:V-type ATP synthase subunit F [Sinomonas humi]|uniref:ATP synthase subunit F n=1 Tax=Sinomonas humi TaxID=1338436 RepID=A0A0B2AQJ8_9MICC|nr:V-type ATP synthase subunit F [Sinomonas humi]KHL04217.1 hypothetical protein LK10_06650 [Sinomonas humi]